MRYINTILILYLDFLYLPFGVIIQVGYHVFSTFFLQVNKKIIIFEVI